MGELRGRSVERSAIVGAWQRALERAERFAAGGLAWADYQRDLSVSYNKMGDLYRALGQGEQARGADQRVVKEGPRLPTSAPER